MNCAPTNSNGIVPYSYDTTPFMPTIEQDKLEENQKECEDKLRKIQALTIRNNAVAFSKINKYILSAKECLKLFDRRQQTCNDALRLSNVIWCHLNSNTICEDFNFSELNIIKSACEMVMGNKLIADRDKITAIKLVNHLSIKTEDLAKEIDHLKANTPLLLNSTNETNPLCLTKFFPSELLHLIAILSHAIIDDIKLKSVDIGMGITKEKSSGPCQYNEVILAKPEKTI
jgi:hypothetical protein